MIILRQKEFNSKAQKAMRRKWDLEQGANAYDILNGLGIGMKTLETESNLNEAQEQFEKLGSKKTINLLKDAQKNIDKDDIFGTSIKESKNKKAQENAIKLLQTGRAKSKNTTKHYDLDESVDFDNYLEREITNNKGGGRGNKTTSLGAKNRKEDGYLDLNLKRQIRDRKEKEKEKSPKTQPKQKANNVKKDYSEDHNKVAKRSQNDILAKQGTVKDRYNKLTEEQRQNLKDRINSRKNPSSTVKTKPNSSKVNKFVKDNKVALGLGGAALIGGGAYLIHKHNKKKKEAENKKNQDK